MNQSKICYSCGGINDFLAPKCRYCNNSIFKEVKKHFYIKNKDYCLEIFNSLIIERKNFSSKFISARHAHLFVRDEELYVLDLGSTNGTYLNGKLLNKMQEYKLINNDRLTFADEEFEVVI